MFKRAYFAGGLLLQEAIEIHQKTGHHRSLTVAILALRRLPQSLRGRGRPLFPRSRILRNALVLAAMVVARAAAAETVPDLTDARVTVPYAELKRLWTAAQPGCEANKAAESKPPVAATLVSAHYQLALNGDQASGSAEFQTQGFTGKWTEMPLLSTDAQIESVEPADTALITRDHYYTLVTNRPGVQKVKILFAVKITSSPDGDYLRLPIAAASINTLTITGVPEKQGLHVTDATRDPSQKDTFRLASDDHFEMITESEESTTARAASRWKIEPQIFAELADGKLAFQERIFADANGGSGLTMDLRIPPEADLDSITGEDLSGWQVITGEDHQRVAHLQWKTRDVLRRHLQIAYDLPQPLTAAEWKLESPQIVSGETSLPPAASCSTAVWMGGR